jgi:hypothetical protein
MQSDLIHPRNEPIVTNETNAQGGKTYKYRGAMIWGNAKGTLFGFRLEGFPASPWLGLGNLDLPCSLVDHWLDHGSLPVHYQPKKA